MFTKWVWENTSSINTKEVSSAWWIKHYHKGSFDSLHPKSTNKPNQDFKKLVEKMTKIEGLLAHQNMMVMAKTQGEKWKT